MEVCRACLSNAQNLVPFDDSFINGYNLLTNLNIKALDGISQYACETCINTVIYFLNFRDQCIASEGTLQQMLLETIKSEQDNIDISETQIFEQYQIQNVAEKTEAPVTKRRPGRPRKSANKTIISEPDNKVIFETKIAPLAKQPVGRPRKSANNTIISEPANKVISETEIAPLAKRRVGRPRKSTANKVSIETVNKDSIPTIAPKTTCSRRKLSTSKAPNKTSIGDPIYDDDASLSTKSSNKLSDGNSKGYIIVPRALNSRPVKKNMSDENNYKAATEEEINYLLNIKDEVDVQIKYEGPDDDAIFDNFDTGISDFEVHLNYSNTINDKDISDVQTKQLKVAKNINEDKIEEKEIFFPCGLCKKKLENQESLSSHLDRHKTDTSCEICKKSFVEWQSLLAHRMQHVPYIYHECHICHEPQTSLYNFENHYLKQHSEETTIPCGLCKKRLENQESLSSHLDSHKANTSCEVCNETFAEWQALLAHRMLHLSIIHHKCHICLKSQRSLHNFEYHYLSQHSGKNLKDVKISCKICLKTYATPLKLKRHIKRSHTSARFICDLCSKIYTCKSSLKKHIILLHCDGKPYICESCGFSTKSPVTLRFHKIRKHSENKAYCKKCTRVFETKEKLDAHKCSDTRNSEAVCPTCGKVTNNMRRHKETHSVVRKHHCPRCPATYRSRGALAAHVNRHTDARPHACPFCPMRFNSQPVLIKHKRVHTGEKPYVCKKCGKGFTANHNLKVHMKIHGEYLIVKRDAPKTE